MATSTNTITPPAGYTVEQPASQAPTQGITPPPGYTVEGPTPADTAHAARASRSQEGVNYGPAEQDHSIAGNIVAGASQVGTGIAKGSAETIHTVGTFLHDHLGIPMPDSVLNPELAGGTDAKNKGEALGKFGEAIGEFFIGDNAIKSLSLANRLNATQQVVKIAAEHPIVAKALVVGMNALRTGTVGTATDLLKGATPGDALKRGAELAAGGAALESATAAAKPAYDAAKEAFSMPEEPIPSAPTAKYMHGTPVKVASPFDDATIASAGGKDLSPEARQVLRAHAGNDIEVGSSPKNHLMKAVAPVNNTIQTQGLALNKILETAGPLQTSPLDEIAQAVSDLQKNLPGGTEESFNKAIDKEIDRLGDTLDSTDPKVLNEAKRALDKRIVNFRAPEEPLDSPADAADAARVVIRRVISNKLSTEIPATKPINEALAKNLEVRSLLRQKFGAIADDSVAADAQQKSELAKGKTILQNKATDVAAKQDYKQQVEKVSGNQKKLATAAKIVIPTAAGAAGAAAYEYLKK